MKDFLNDVNISAIIIDMMLIVVVVYNIVKSARAGFLSSLISLVLTLVSYVVVLPASNIISENIYSRYLKEIVSKWIELKLVHHGVTDLNFLQNILKYTMSPETTYFTKNIDQINKIKSVSDLSDLISDKFIYPVLNICLCLVLLMVIRWILSLINKVLKKLFRYFSYVPVLGKVNILLGGVFGCCKSLVIILFIVLIINSVIAVSADQWQYLNTQVKNETHILKRCDELLKAVKISDFLNKIENEMI